MRPYILVIILIQLAGNLVGSDFISCHLIFKDGTNLTGYAKTPDMLDKSVKYKEKMNSPAKDIPSDDLSGIVFTQDSKDFTYQRVLTYKNYGNKEVNKKDSWLKIVKSGYLSLYYGYEHGMNSPAYNLWYFKKANDPIAYFITMKYSGGIVFTIGTGSEFKDNASIYLSDYEELANKISNSEYKLEDIELVVDLYNEWRNSK